MDSDTIEFERLGKPGRPPSGEVEGPYARRLADALDTALEPHEVLALLAELRISDAFVGAACGDYAPATVAGWRAGRRAPNEVAADRLDQLRAVVSYLISGLADYVPERPALVAARWLTKRRRWPGHEVPRRGVDLIAAGEFDPVYLAAEEFVQRLHARPKLEDVDKGRRRVKAVAPDRP